MRAADRLQSAGPVAEEARREWLVRAAERCGTRWHGLYELAPSTDALHDFYDRSGREPGEGLSPEELDRLASGFVKVQPVDGTLPMMLALFAGHADRDVDRAAVSAVAALVREGSLPWWLPDAMARVLERYADPNARYRPGMDEPDCAEILTCARIDLAALPGVCQDARPELGIPDVPPARVPALRVRGVGGETPDCLVASVFSGGCVSRVTTFREAQAHTAFPMSGPLDLTEPELARCGLGAIERRKPSGETVTRIYCLRCGSQIPADRREVDPGGWWVCARGCNTRYSDAGSVPPSRPPT